MLPGLASSIIRKSAVSALITLLEWASRTASFTLIIKSAVGSLGTYRYTSFPFSSVPFSFLHASDK